MKFHWDKKYLHWGITALLVVCGGILFYYLLFHSSSLFDTLKTILNITMPVIDGFIVAYLLSPVLNLIEKKCLFPAYAALSKNKQSPSIRCKRNMRKLSVLLTMLLTFFFLYCFFSILIPQLITSIQSIIQQFPYYLQNLNDWILGIFDNNPDLEATMLSLLNRYSAKVEDWVTSNLIPQANQVLRMVSTGVIGSVIGFAKALWNLLIGFIISIYLLNGKETFAGQGKKIIYSLFHVDTANIFVSNVRFIHRTFIGFIGGKIVDSIIIGIICYFGTLLMGTPYPVLISVIVGVTNVIPFFGPYMGAIPSALLILMVNPPQCLYFIIFILVLQQFDGNILGPKILGDSTGLNSFWVIFAITFFGGLMGVLGMVIGVPVFAVIYAGIRAVTDQKLEERNLPIATSEYVGVRSIGENGAFTQYEPHSSRQKKSSGEASSEEQIGFGDSWLLLKRKKQNKEDINVETLDSSDSENKQ